MGNIYLLDCTLRDGGYINNWEFGYEAIRNIGRKIAKSGVEGFEVGFIKGNTFEISSLPTKSSVAIVLYISIIDSMPLTILS